MIFDSYDKFLNDSLSFDNTMDDATLVKKLSILTPPDDEIKKLLIWDIELFECCEIPLEQREKNQNFLFPKWVDENGINVPDIENFELERVEFYKHRCSIVTSHFCKIRYLNYLFEHGEKEQKYRYAAELVNVLFEHIKNENLSHQMTVDVSRFLEISLLFNISQVLDKINELVISIFSDKYRDEDRIWILPISRSLSTKFKNKKDFLSGDTIALVALRIKEFMESYLEAREYAQYRNGCHCYIDWLKISHCDEQIKSALVEFGDSYVHQAEADGVSYLSKASLYEEAVKHFVNIGERQKVYQLKIKIKEAHRKASENGEYKGISATNSISAKELDDEIRVFIGETVQETLNKISHASDFIPKKSILLQEAIKESENPIYKFVDLAHISGNRKVFSTGSSEDVIHYLLCNRYSIAIEVTFSILFNRIWDDMISKGLTCEMLTERICTNEYMTDEQREIVSIGLKHFMNSDYISCLHLLVPQLEGFIRTMFEWGGFPTTTIQNGGTQNEQTFNEFLHQDFVKSIFDENILFLIEFVLVEQLGKNLRNNIAHGLLELKSFNKTNCLIIIYLYFLSTAIHWKF